MNQYPVKRAASVATRTAMALTVVLMFATCLQTTVSAEPENAAPCDPVDLAAPIKVAVLDLSAARGASFTSCNVTMSPLTEAGREMSDELAERLKTWSGYELLDRQTVRKAVAKHKLEKRGLHKLETLEKLAELTGADAVVVGQTEGSMWSGKGHAGASLYASVQMLSTHTAEVVWNIDGSLVDTRSSQTIVTALASDMTDRLYVKLQEIEAARPLFAYRETNRDL